MKFVLKFLEGGLAGQSKEADVYQGRHVAVGRDPTAGIVLGDKDRAASMQHAKFVLEGKDVVVTDVGSTYGLYVNKKATIKAKLKSGDEVRFGMKGPLAIFETIEAPGGI